MTTRQDLNYLSSFLNKVYDQSFPTGEYPAVIEAALKLDSMDAVIWELGLQAARCSTVFGYRPPYNLSVHRDMRSINTGHLGLITRNDMILIFVIQTINGGLEFTYLRKENRLYLSNWYEVGRVLDSRDRERYVADVDPGTGLIADLVHLRMFMEYAGPRHPGGHFQIGGLNKLASDHGVKADLLRKFIDQVNHSNPD